MSTVNGSGRCGRQSDGHPTRGHEQVVRFNGAATFQPRNAVLEAAKGRSSTCFNGAATFQPRNDHVRGRREHFMPASMGPRLFSRGMPVARFRVRLDDRASMGPRLFSRGMRKYHIIQNNLSMLQWGRDFSAAECSRTNTSAAYCSSFNGAATFQPRNARRASQRKDAEEASMGPRLFSRGMRTNGHERSLT